MTAADVVITPERWLLRCPVDDAWLGSGITECPDCGLSTQPLRALASVAAGNLEIAAAVSPALAQAQVEAAAGLVPDSENFLLDAGRALSAAGAYESAREVLGRAAKIAPGRKDIKAELEYVSRRVDPTAWLTSGPPRPVPMEAQVPQAPRGPRPVPQPTSGAELACDCQTARPRDEVSLGSTGPRRAVTVIMPFGRPAKTYLVPVSDQKTMR